MTIRPIVLIPDPILRKPSEPAGPATPALRELAQDMLETMYDAPGIGLAAIQIGVPTRIVVIDLAKGEDEPKNPIVLLDPEITWSSDEMNVHQEGCLSIPEYFEEVERPKRVRVRYRTLEDEVKEIEADELLATCLQHEIDHINGVLFIDHLSKLKRDRVTRKFAKAAKREASGA
ncbi:peptide deformylase [Chelatococcus reniformis]|uniref:Peptide deformylase n=1 Tax=Chelatococcus reniformis TaxID=1494448 RepID=A0A916XL07_9HYPH|nr:peptide deformylase [Chelatococcus reniformis]GGC79959.1 peptide deformylase [Chelatococcus reniformis]